MYITWYGQSCFQLQFGKNKQDGATVIMDPFGKDTGLKVPPLEGDVVLISHDHFDHNNTDSVKGDFFLVKEPGQYEIKDVFIEGIAGYHDNKQGAERGSIVIYRIESEGVRICFLSDLGQDKLTDNQVEKIGEVDILIVPVGGVYTIDGKQAHNIISQVIPKMVIPMHYKITGLKIDLEDETPFLKAMGVSKPEGEKKLKVQQNDFAREDDDIEVVLLEPQ